jgi:hypothetical protein
MLCEGPTGSRAVSTMLEGESKSWQKLMEETENLGPRYFDTSGDCLHGVGASMAQILIRRLLGMWEPGAENPVYLESGIDRQNFRVLRT